MSRGALYIIWGGKHDEVLSRSINSLAKVHPDFPVKIIRFDDNKNGLHCKARMLSLSPFDETVFLDADTVVLRPLDFGFEKAAQFGLACCIAARTWAACTGYCDDASETIMYNTGVLFFTNSARPIFTRWEELSAGPQPGPKGQGPFALAVEQSKINPYVLPLNWNYQHHLHRSFTGPITIWHSYRAPPSNILDFNQRRKTYETTALLGRANQLKHGWRLICEGLGLRNPLCIRVKTRSGFTAPKHQYPVGKDVGSLPSEIPVSPAKNSPVSASAGEPRQP